MYGTFAIERIEVALSGSQRQISENPRLGAALLGTQLQGTDATPAQTYVILEGARYFAPRETLESSGLPFRCLFKGESEETLADVAPYLVKIDRDASLVTKLLSGLRDDDPPWMM